MDNEIRQEIRDDVRQEINEILGRLRSVASQLKAQGKTEDEEHCFKLLLQDLSGCISTEIGKLAGPAEAARFLDPFSRPKENG